MSIQVSVRLAKPFAHNNPEFQETGTQSGTEYSLASCKLKKRTNLTKKQR